MLLKEINDLIIAGVPSITGNDPATRALTTQYFNFAWDEVCRSSNWWFRKRSGQIVLEPAYTTSCTVTQFNSTNSSTSQIVTLSSPLPYNVRGRYLKLGENSSTYKIIVGNAGESTLVLDVPVIEGSGTYSCSIYRRIYYLKSDVGTLIDIRETNGGGDIEFLSSAKLSDFTVNTDSVGNPDSFSDFGIDPYDDVSHVTGTISIPANSNTVTGVATNFIGNVNSGDILTVDNKTYTVKRVESDTSLILFNYAVNLVSSGSSYSIKPNSPIGLKFYHPTDVYRVLEYEYVAKFYPIYNEEYDEILVDRDFIDAAILDATARWLQNKDYQKYLQITNLYQAKLQGLKIKKRVVNPKYRQFEPKINLALPGRD